MSNEKKTLDLIHTKIHALRMMKYKPSRFEVELNNIIAQQYKDDCDECKAKIESDKYKPAQQYEEKSFLGGLFKS